MNRVWLLSVLLVGCSHATKPDPLPVIVPVKYECGTPPGRELMPVLPVRWVILPFGEDQLFTLTAAEYQNLGENVSKVILGIQQLKGELSFYKECVAPPTPSIVDDPTTD